MASLVTNKGALDRLGSWLTATIKALLVTSSQALAKTDNFVSEMVANELGVAGYSRQTLASKTLTEDDTNHRVVESCGNIAFGSCASGATIGACIFFRDTGNDATAPIWTEDDVANTATNGSTITYVPHANGVAYTQQ